MFIQNVDGITLDNTTVVNSIYGLNLPNWKSAVAENVLYVGWLIENNSNSNDDLFLKRFSDDGKMSIMPFNMTHGELEDFRMAAAANKVFVVWSDQTEGKEGIYLRRSVDNGNSFSVPLAVIKGFHTMIGPTATGVVATDKDLYIAYRNITDNKIWVAASHNNGESFRSTNIANTTDLEIVAMTAVDNYIYILLSENFYGDNLYFTRSINNGNIFQDITKLSDNVGSSADMKVFKNYIYIEAFDKIRNSISFLMNDNNGDSFRSSNVKANLLIPEVRSMDNNMMILYHTLLSEPEMAAFENSVYLIWSSRSSLYTIDRNGTIVDEVSTIETINEAVSNDNGHSFVTLPINLRQYFNFTNVHQSFPFYAKISTIGYNSLAVWRDGLSRENSDLFMIVGSTHENVDDLNEGIRFEALPLVLSNRSATGPFNWKIESSDLGNAYIIWDEAEPFTGQENPRNFDLLFRKVH